MYDRPSRMVEITHVAAVALALGAALANAVHNLLVRLGTDEGRADDAVFVVIAVNVAVLVPLVGVVYYPNYGFTRVSVLSFVVAGLLGTMLGRAFKYHSISRIGASRTEPIVASWALFASLLGVVVLGESLSWIHGLGIVLIVAGVAAIAWETSHENPDDLSARELAVGLAIPLCAALAYAGEPIFANFGFAEGTPSPVGLVVKTIAAVLGFTLYLRWHDALPALSELRSGDARLFVLAGLTNSLFLLGYYVSLGIAPVNVVTPIVATSTLFVVALSALFMPRRLERVTWRLVAAATVVVVGVVAVTVYG